MKISPNEAIAPLHRPATGICGSVSSTDCRALAEDDATPRSAPAPSGRPAAGPATNRPPIDRLATKPRMIRLMQGGMVSAITAEAASNATALPGFCLERRAAGISTEPTAATSAILEPEMPENSTIDITMTTFSPPRMRPTSALQQLDQANRHAVRLHQVADQDEERDRQQHEIVDAARHLLGEDHAGQRALDPDEDQRRQRQRKADRQAAEQRDEEADQHQRARRRHRCRATASPRPDRGRRRRRSQATPATMSRSGRAQKMSSANTVMNSAPTPIG